MEELRTLDTRGFAAYCWPIGDRDWASPTERRYRAPALKAEEVGVSIKLKVLIAEDDFLIADMAEEFLVENGFDVCGIACTVEEAVALGKLHKPDLAMVDYRLADGRFGTEVATLLLAMGKVGILYATGNYSTNALMDASGVAVIGKPYRAENLVLALDIVADIVTTGVTVRPFPRGFQLLKGASLWQAELSHD